jgi:hypothetical protein
LVAHILSVEPFQPGENGGDNHGITPEAVPGVCYDFQLFRIAGLFEQAAGMADRDDIVLMAVDDAERPRGNAADVVFRGKGNESVEPVLSRFREIRITDGTDLTIAINNRLSVAAFQEKRKVGGTGAGDKARNSAVPSGDIYGGSGPATEAHQEQSRVPEAIEAENIVSDRLKVAGPAGNIQVAAAIPGTAEIEEKDRIPMGTNAFRQLRITTITGLRGIARRYAVTKANSRVAGIFIRQETLTDDSDTIDLKRKIVSNHN